jgi:hypothetical protein
MNPQPKRNRTLAVTSLVLGILSLVPLSIVAGIPAVITGHIARRRVAEAPEQYDGGRAALAGLIMGYISILVAVGFILLAVSLLAPLTDKRNRGQAQTIRCLNNLKQVSIALRLYAADHRGTFPTNFMQLKSQLGSPGILICPLDPDRSVSQREWNPDGISYKFLRPGEEQRNVLDEVIVSCPFHGNAVAGDGTVGGGSGGR